MKFQTYQTVLSILRKLRWTFYFGQSTNFLAYHPPEINPPCFPLIFGQKSYKPLRFFGVNVAPPPPFPQKKAGGLPG